MQEQMGMDLVSRVFFGDSGEIWLCHAFPCVLIKVWGPTSAIYGSLKWPPSNSLAKCEQIGAVISSCDFFPCGVKASLEEFEVNGKRHFPVSMQRRGEDKCNSLPIAGLWRSIRVLGYACLGNACPPSSCPSFIVGDHLWYNQNSSKSCHLQQVLLVFIFPALTLGFIEDLALPAVFYPLLEVFMVWLRDSCGYLSSGCLGSKCILFIHDWGWVEWMTEMARKMGGIRNFFCGFLAELKTLFRAKNSFVSMLNEALKTLE